MIRAGVEAIRDVKEKDPVGHVDSDLEEGVAFGYTATANPSGRAFDMGLETRGILKS